MLAGGDDDLPWMKLAEGVKSGKTPVELAWGTGIWQNFKDRPERDHIFAQAMVSSQGPLSSKLSHDSNAWPGCQTC